MRSPLVLIVAALLFTGLVGLLVFAWIDGGREPVHIIAEPVRPDTAP